MLWARFAFVAVIVIPAAILAFFQIVDPGISHAFVPAFTYILHNITAGLSAHPLEAVVALGTAFPIDPLDRVMTLKEWRVLRRLSASTERRLRAAGLGPKITYLTQSLIGIRVRDDLQWLEAGGASGALAQSADPPAVKKNTGRDTRAATAASVAKRKAAAPAPTATSPAELATTPESVNAA
jgi:hypothetical protein